MNNYTKLYLAIQISQALSFLHSSEPSLMHLDVKPSNILVNDNYDYNLLSWPRFIIMLFFGFCRLKSQHIILYLGTMVFRRL